MVVTMTAPNNNTPRTTARAVGHFCFCGGGWYATFAITAGENDNGPLTVQNTNVGLAGCQ
jgi:hypothetical protein